MFQRNPEPRPGEPLSGAQLWGRLLALPRLERPAKDKHSSLLKTFVNYGRKKFHYICP